MKKYKVCRLIGEEVISPFQEFSYGKESELFGKRLTFKFDDSNEECSEGFYATDADGIIYSLNKSKDCNVYEVEVGGKEKKFDEYKQRYSEATFIRRLSDAEVKKIIREQSEKMDWNYYEACYPVNPFLIDVPFDTEKAVKLLKQWDSVWDSVRAYVSSFFPNIKKWKGINHKEGLNPFQSGIDLWMMGLIPSFDGKTWRLHKGKKAEVVFEITQKGLEQIDEEKA